MPREIRSAIGDRERRFIPVQASGVALRAKTDDKARTIEGYGALFNTETVIGMWFREVILPGAFTDSLKTDDIRVFYNHDPNYILGRTSAKTATVEEDTDGLRYEATPPATRADVVESIERKDVTGSSFQFSVEEDEGEEWDFSETKKGMLPLRKIKRARLYEVGPVCFPAYEDTTVSARAVAKVEEAKQLRDAAAAAACPSCNGSGLNPERGMSDPKGQSPCDHCKGDGKRDGASEKGGEKAHVTPAAAPNQQHPEAPAEMPVELLAMELDLLEL
jgi:HK97 family phage prohead protease